MRTPIAITAAAVFAVAVTASRAGVRPTAGPPDPFAAYVLVYAPAPGQFVNHPDFNDPDAALGPPAGRGLADGNNADVVSLGGFGGYIVLGFDHRVMDDPLNPLGLDAIVFGNAFWVGGNPDRHWAECGIIEISRDDNGNGLPDDAWYLIPGSHLTNPSEQLFETTWDDDVLDPTFPPHDADQIPPGMSGTWTTSGFMLDGEPFGSSIVVNPGPSGEEGVRGYADYAPTLLLGDLDADNTVEDVGIPPEEFYTVPDDPLTAGMTPGSGGGDAFDIARAVDPATGESAGLAGFDFIRITTGVVGSFDRIGEQSTEIDAVADVAPDPFGDLDGDGDIDLFDAAEFQVCFGGDVGTADQCGSADRQPDGRVDSADAGPFLSRVTGPIARGQR